MSLDPFSGLIANFKSASIRCQTQILLASFGYTLEATVSLA